MQLVQIQNKYYASLSDEDKEKLDQGFIDNKITYTTNRGGNGGKTVLAFKLVFFVHEWSDMSSTCEYKVTRDFNNYFNLDKSSSQYISGLIRGIEDKLELDRQAELFQPLSDLVKGW